MADATSERGAAGRRRDEELLQLLDADPPAWIVTPTRRLARALRLRVAELRADAGRSVSETPPIHSLADWLDRLGREALAAEVDRGERGRVLLSPGAERVLWERVIADAPGDLPRQLLDIVSLAATASDAWSRTCLWGEPSWAGPVTEDVEAFRRWLPSLRARLHEGAFATTAELASIVAAAIRGDRLASSVPAVVVALDFEKHDPALERLLQAVRERGADVRDRATVASAAPVEPRAWIAPTPTAELRTVASRIRALLLERPDLRIGVLAPDTSAWGSRLERVFEEELDPEGILAPGASSARRFDFAEAPSLADYPLVANAFDLLSLEDGPVPFELASRILLAAHPRRRGLAAGDQQRERALRGRAEALLRRERASSLRLVGRAGSLATTLRQGGLGETAALVERLATRLASARPQPGRRTSRTPTEWRNEWHERLAILGWPGELEGDAEGLLFRRWREALDEFVALEAIEPRMEAHHALARLRAICAGVPVQPPATNRSVQVVSLLDAAGFDFDVVFAIGLTSTAFPPPPRPNPLLPVAWQRTQAGMPRVSVDAERELATAVWQRVLRSAPEVWASWSAAGDAGEEQSPSSFLARLAAEPPGAAEGRPWWLAAAAADGATEPLPTDEAGAPLVRSGGSALLTRQSDCPFRALAATRLAAEPLQAIEAQPNAALRGTLVHDALAKAYTDIPSSSDLDGLGDRDIAEVARVAAAHALEQQKDFLEDAPDLAAVVGAWLVDLVASWMHYERGARTVAWAVDASEHDDTATFPPGAAEPLTIRFRADRIDRHEDGGLVVLDYKTSATPKSPSLWNGERPKDPQLPLYLALLEARGERVDGIAFANLSARDACVLHGVGAGEYGARFRPPGRKAVRSAEDYRSRADEWRDVLAGLANAYLAGDVRVAPREAAVCRNCGSQAFCRIAELGPPDEDDGDAEEGGE